MNDNQRKVRSHRKVIAFTMGDPAGIGPEIIAKGWSQITRDQDFAFLVFGLESTLVQTLESDSGLAVRAFPNLIEFSEWFDGDKYQATVIPVIQNKDWQSIGDSIPVGQVSDRAGDAAFRFIEAAIQATISGDIDGIVTAPINKEAIQLAGHDFPGHTEILADRCGVKDFAMMLYIPQGQQVGGEIGVGVLHTTLHQSLRSALDDLSTEKIFATCKLANEFAAASLQQAGVERQPRIAVAAVNPHAGENGLFGNEESEIILPAVQRARDSGIDCTGPLPCDTLMGRAVAGEFDMVVAMYHDQGHIALKLLGMHKAVNVTVGLPIVRTSVAHGTAFEIAGTGQADCTSLFRAVEVAKRLATAATPSHSSNATPQS